MTQERRQPIQISVVIPVYNGHGHIGRAIQSVLEQSHPPDEIIVVDDGSTDKTARIVKSCDRIRYIYQDNAGASAARNRGVEAATNEWIAFLDADDEWETDKLKLQVELLQRNPELVWTTANFQRCLCDEGRRAADINPAKAQKLLDGKDYFEEFFRAFVHHGCGWTGTMLIRKEAIKQAGMFTPGLSRANDLDLWFRIAYLYPQIGFTPQPLATYHMAIPDSITNTHKQLDILADLLKRHLELAAEHDRLEAFRTCAGFMVTSWIRGLFFENRPDNIRMLVRDFGEMLSKRFVLLTKLVLICPSFTAGFCHMISKIVRALKLRKQIVRKPERPEKR